MAQIIRVTSEALQATVRRLLPSQQGFGEDLQASNVIQPIIDLTPTAEGSEVRADLQTALAFGSQTAVTLSNGSSTIANSPGFWRLFGALTIKQASSSSESILFRLGDGSTTKVIYEMFVTADTGPLVTTQTVDFTVFLRAGDELTGSSSSINSYFSGSVRQVADASGNLINPSGFTPQ